MKVKLILGNSYADGVVFVKKDNPIVEVSEDEGQSLLASGHFELVETPAVPEPEESDDEPESPDDTTEEDNPIVEVPEDDKEYIIPPVDFDKMTVKQLKDYAVENEIDISGLTTKSEIKQALIEAINSRVPEIFTE